MTWIGKVKLILKTLSNQFKVNKKFIEFINSKIITYVFKYVYDRQFNFNYYNCRVFKLGTYIISDNN